MSKTGPVDTHAGALAADRTKILLVEDDATAGSVVLGFAPLRPAELGVVVMIGAGLLVVLELTKRLPRLTRHPSSALL